RWRIHHNPCPPASPQRWERELESILPGYSLVSSTLLGCDREKELVRIRPGVKSPVA
ncbi:unnamed protein product, partial [Caretta caretta]